jgi:CBS domain-containing protein
MTVDDVVSFFTAPDAPERHKSYPVVDEAGHLQGIVARADVLRWTREGWLTGQALADAVSERDCVSGFSDELAGQVADRMAEADVGRVPILRRTDGIVIGLVARRDLLRIRARAVGHERHREALIRFDKRRSSTGSDVRPGHTPH